MTQAAGVDIRPYALDREIKVSVLVLTYNHAEFVGQAIESALAQQVPFRFEIVVGEDLSKDNTRSIVSALQDRYPEQIRLLPRDKNLGMHENFVQTLRSCRGEYIAMLEGDDYWTSPQKLTRQIAFLDKHRECSAAFHDIRVNLADGTQRAPVALGTKPFADLADLFTKYYIPTCSIVFRHGIVQTLPYWLSTLGAVDTTFWKLLAVHGRIAFLDEVMAVYRLHQGGMWSTQDPMAHVREEISAVEYANGHFASRYEALALAQVKRLWLIVVERRVEEALDERSATVALRRLENELSDRPAGPRLANLVRGQLLSRFHLSLALAAHQRDDPSGVRTHLRRAIAYDPALLRNRGVWSAGLQALVGKTLVSTIRSAFRRTSGPSAQL